MTNLCSLHLFQYSRITMDRKPLCVFILQTLLLSCILLEIDAKTRQKRNHESFLPPDGTDYGPPPSFRHKKGPRGYDPKHDLNFAGFGPKRGNGGRYPDRAESEGFGPTTESYFRPTQPKSEYGPEPKQANFGPKSGLGYGPPPKYDGFGPPKYGPPKRDSYGPKKSPRHEGRYSPKREGGYGLSHREHNGDMYDSKYGPSYEPKRTGGYEPKHEHHSGGYGPKHEHHSGGYGPKHEPRRGEYGPKRGHGNGGYAPKHEPHSGGYGPKSKKDNFRPNFEHGYGYPTPRRNPPKYRPEHDGPSEYERPPNRYDGPREKHDGPHHYDGPHDKHNGPHDYGGAHYKHNGPHDKHNGPHDYDGPHKKYDGLNDHHGRKDFKEKYDSSYDYEGPHYKHEGPHDYEEDSQSEYPHDAEAKSASHRHIAAYKKGIQCYQCAYSPSKVEYKTIKVHEESYNPYSHSGGPTSHYQKKKVAVKTHGGWDKCKGPFGHKQAKWYGIDVWDCHHNCYTRQDHNGNLFRGCYKGEYNVNPNKLGCNYQGDSLYCFCKGDKCNNGPPPKNKY